MCCLEQYIFPPGVERLLPVFSDALEPLFNYLPPDAVLVLDEPAVIDTKLEEFNTVRRGRLPTSPLAERSCRPSHAARYLAPSIRRRMLPGMPTHCTADAGRRSV